MADQILSQEEIDALLGAMATGDVDLNADDEKAHAAKPYDLTSKSVQLADEFSALDEVFDKFNQRLQKSLSAILQKEVNVEFASKEVKNFASLIKGYTNPTLFNLLSMEPLLNTALVIVEPELVFSFIDCMFGGSGKPFGRMREFSLIELNVMKKISNAILQELENAWEVVSPSTVVLKKVETKPEFVHIFGDAEMVMVASFTVKTEEFEGVIYFCVSYLALEALKEKLSANYIREKDIEHKWSDEIERLIQDAQLDVVAELGSTTQSVRDVLNYKRGDIIRLHCGPQDFVTLKVNSVSKFRGFPGVRKGSRAVEIASRLDANREHTTDAGS